MIGKDLGAEIRGAIGGQVCRGPWMQRYVGGGPGGTDDRGVPRSVGYRGPDPPPASINTETIRTLHLYITKLLTGRIRTVCNVETARQTLTNRPIHGQLLNVILLKVDKHQPTETNMEGY